MKSNLKRILDEKGISQRELAKRLKISLPTIQKIANAVESCRLSYLLEVAKELDVSLPVLIFEKKISERR